MDLQPGQLLRLDRDPDGLLEMRVEGRPKLAVRPQVSQGNMAAEVVSRILPPDDGHPAPPPHEGSDAVVADEEHA